MAKSASSISREDGILQNSDVPDEVVSQVGKAVVKIVQLRQTLEENMAAAKTNEEREALTGQVESAAVQAIDDAGLTVSEYNQVIAAAQADSELEERVLIACRAA